MPRHVFGCEQRTVGHGYRLEGSGRRVGRPFGGVIHRCARMMAQIDGGGVTVSELPDRLQIGRMPDGMTVESVRSVDL